MLTKGSFVKTQTEDKLQLRGFFAEGEKSKDAYIFIHGFISDFYSWDFYHSIMEKVSNLGNAFVLAQNRGTGCVSELLKYGDNTGEETQSVFLGSYLEKLEDAHLDISAWIEFLIKEGYKNIVLIGHSVGSIKVVRYMTEGKYKERVKALVLIAPFDKNGFIKEKIGEKYQETVRKMKLMIADGQGTKNVTDEIEDYPVSIQTWVSWYESTDLNNIWDFHRKEYISPVLQELKLPVKVIFGDCDEGVALEKFNVNQKDVVKYLQHNIPHADISIIEGANHCFEEKETELANSIANFAKAL